MTRNEALSILKRLKPELQARYGVERVGIFGSIVREESREGSDVDVVVDMPPDLSGGAVRLTGTAGGQDCELGRVSAV
jgi:predicted nucleotidyltransferase